MDELSGLVTLLQGVSSPALVILSVFAWNLNKQVSALTGRLGEIKDVIAQCEIRLAVIENELSLEANGNKQSNPQRNRR